MPDFAAAFHKRAGEEPTDARLDAPTFHRNFEPVRAVLERFLKERSGHALEIGSGTGQHVVGFAKAFPALTWWPSDPNPDHRRSIAAWRDHIGVPNVMAPLALDASRGALPSGEGAPPGALAAVVSMNVIHISPWAVCEGIARIAGRHLEPGGFLFLYGPFRRGGVHTAPSNAAFDASLRNANPEWGVRDLESVQALAAENGLRLHEVVEMPANNLTLVFRREDRPAE